MISFVKSDQHFYIMETHFIYFIYSMTDSALGESTVTSPVIGHSADTICGDGVQLLSPNRGRDWPIFIIDIYHLKLSIL